MSSEFDKQLIKIMAADGFIAALDQSGGSTPKALRLYGIPDDAYVAGEDSMFDEVHEMRARIMTSDKFNGDRILGSILFENTIEREVGGMPTAEFLWKKKNIVPFLKVDKGLAPEENGVQLMKPIPNLDELLKKGKAAGCFGTKMRSVIKLADADGVKANVEQQFDTGNKIIQAGLVPIIEPEIDIKSPEKKEAEVLLKAQLLDQLNKLGPDEKVMLKLTLPSVNNFYQECINHPNCLRMVALSGGYTRAEANAYLAKNKGMVASFSRALTEGLSANDTAAEFDAKLDESIGSIFTASIAG